MMKLLDGADVAAFIKERQAKQVRNLRQSWQVVPRLAIVQTIDDPVIDTYVRLKRRYAEDILVECELHHVSQAEIAQTLEILNQRHDVHGVIVQLPLADPEETETVVKQVSSAKDVDGLGDSPAFVPATALAIDWLLAAYNVELQGANIAIVGNGRLVGAPLAALWSQNGYQVSVADSTTTDLASYLADKDLIVTATGVPRLIQADMIKQNAVVVDAGTAAEHGVVFGDIDESVRERDDLTITPEKGGVGPLTVAALFDNVITAARRTADFSR